MALTLTDMINRVRAKLGVTSSDALYTDSALTISINSGLAAMAAERDWPWLEATGAITISEGTTEYALPDDLTRIHLLSIDDDPLEEVQYRDIVLRKNWVAGTPRVFAVIGPNIKIAPEPNEAATIDIWYQTTEPVLAITTDTITCPTHFAELPVCYAAIDASVKSPDRPHLAELYRLKDEWLRRVQDSVQRSSIAPQISTRTDNWVGY